MYRGWVVSIVILISSPVFGRDLDPAEKRIIAHAVTENFKDPESARFRWLPVTKDDQRVYCGMVNGKNSFGAYIGYSPFVAFLFQKNGKVVVAAPLDTGAAGTADAIAVMKFCAVSGIDPTGAKQSRNSN